MNTPTPSRNGPLAGIVVLDTSSVLFGPYATLLLGEMGADVIKLEGFEGDNTRHIGPARTPGMAGVFLNLNRNKRSIAVDLKRDEGRRIALELARSADIFVTNIRRKAVARLGLGYEAVAAENPGIIYCNAVGYGRGGPYEDYPAFDDTVQAISGLASLQSAFAGKPEYVAMAVADKVSGIMLALGIVTALRHRDVTGIGQRVEVPMFETMVSFNLVEHLYGRSFVPPLGPATYPRVVSKFRRPYKTLDGYVAIVPYNDGQWLRFFSLVGQPELARDERFATMAGRTKNIDALYEILAAQVAGRSTATWLASMREQDIPAVPVKSCDELIDDPHLVARGFFRESLHPSEGRLLSVEPAIGLSASPLGMTRPAPRLGEHTVEVLTAIGYDTERIDALLSDDVVRLAPDAPPGESDD